MVKWVFQRLKTTFPFGQTVYRIRQMRSEDYASLIALWKAAGLPCRLKGRDAQENIERELKGACSIFLVAEMDGVVVGGSPGHP